MAKVVGIDPSLSNTALYYVEDFHFNNDELLIHTDKKKNKEVEKDEKGKKKKKLSTEEILERMDRQRDIYLEVLNFLRKKKPDYIGIEGYSFAGNSLAVQAEVTGVILLAISIYKKINNNVKVLIFTPQSVKKYILGSGGGGKQLVLKEVYKKYNLDVDNDNIADAFVISQLTSDFAYLENNKKFRFGMKKYQQDIFHNIYIAKELIKKYKIRKMKDGE